MIDIIMYNEYIILFANNINYGLAYYPGNTTTINKRISNVSERLVFRLKCRVLNGCIKVFSNVISVAFR